MIDLLNALSQAIEQKNWHAALYLSLTLPDVCVRLQDPAATRGKHYIEWATTYFEPMYTAEISAERERHVFLSGTDLYALRCAVLHAASDNVSGERVAQALQSFAFFEPAPSGSVHMNQFDDALQLDVKKFCFDMIEAVNAWLSTVDSNEEVMIRGANRLRIRGWNEGGF